MTLGVAAAIGLAGFAALPVLAAASVFESVPKQEVIKSVNPGKWNHVKTKTYTKVVDVDDDFEATYADFKTFLNGKAAANLTDYDTQAAAGAAAAEDGKIEANDTIIFKGTFAKSIALLNSIMTKAGTDADVKKALEDKLKNIVLDVQDTTNLTIAKGDIQKLNSFVDESGVKTVKIKVENAKKVKELTLSNIDADKFEALTGKVSFDHAFEKLKTNGVRVEDAKKVVNLLDLKYKKAEFAAVPGSDNAVDYENGNYTAPKPTPENNDQNNNQQNNNNTAGNTQNRPNGAPAAPNTGIAE